MKAKQLLSLARDYIAEKSINYHEAKSQAVFADQYERCEMMELSLSGMEELVDYLEEILEQEKPDFSDIRLEDVFENNECQEVTYFFTAPKDLIDQCYPGVYEDAVGTEVSVTFPMGHIDAEHATVEISPTREVQDGFSDYDWNEIILPYEDVEELFKIVESNRNWK